MRHAFGYLGDDGRQSPEQTAADFQRQHDRRSNHATSFVLKAGRKITPVIRRARGMDSDFLNDFGFPSRPRQSLSFVVNEKSVIGSDKQPAAHR